METPVAAFCFTFAPPWLAAVEWAARDKALIKPEGLADADATIGLVWCVGCDKVPLTLAAAAEDNADDDGG